MKKKVISMLMAGLIVMGSTGVSFAACGDSLDIQSKFDNFYSTFINYIYNCSQNNSNEVSKPQVPDTETSFSSKAEEILSLVNEERLSAGLSALTIDTRLNEVAQIKAEDMAKNNYFSHTSPTYGSAFDMLKNNGISYKTAGENIAKGQKTAESVMAAWMNSSGHKANILGNGYTSLGVGYTVDESGNTYWVQIFMG